MQNPYKKKSILNPQKENGHRRINNEVYHALTMYPFTGAELRVAMTVIDRTWGWDLTSAPISLNQYMAATNLSRQGVIKAIKSLSDKRVLLVKRVPHSKNNVASEYLFNKHFDTWIGSQRWLTTLIPQPEPEQLSLGSQPQLTTQEEGSQPQLPKGSQPQLTTVVNQGLLQVVNWPDRAPLLLQQYLQQYITTNNIDVGPLKPEALEVQVIKLLTNVLRAKVFELLKEKRGYVSPNAGAEAKAITWMLRQDYSVGDIMQAYNIMAGKPFWKDKELLMPSVQGQIGKIMKGSGSGISTDEELKAWKQ